MTLDVRWKRVQESRPLLDLLPAVPDDERFAVIMGDDGVVGWGVAERIPVGAGPNRFLRARDGLAAIAGDSDPVAFSSFTFDADDDSSVMIVPLVAVMRRGGVTRRMTVGEGGTSWSAPAPQSIDADRPRYAGSTVRDEVWLEAVATAIGQIEDGQFAKVVLARDLHLWSKHPFDTSRLLRDLAERFPSCRTFLVDHLLGASPELLLSRRGATVHSRVLAGTAARGEDAASDAELGATLLASAKDQHEHDLALTSAIDALAPHCVTLEAPDAPSLVRLDNVQHLGSDLSGTLRRADDDTLPHVLDLLAELHPTAAVGGTPRDAALSAIGSLEQMSRGRYSGPVGWCTPQGDGEFAIALRCAEVRGARARLFAGAGIVAGSLPEAELSETWMKLRAMTSVLGH